MTNSSDLTLIKPFLYLATERKRSRSEKRR